MIDQATFDRIADETALGALRLRRSCQRLLDEATAAGRKGEVRKLTGQLARTEKMIAERGIEAYVKRRGLVLEPFEPAQTDNTRSGWISTKPSDGKNQP